MRLAVGQVWEHRTTGEQVVVLQVRDENHSWGLGKPYGDSGLAWPCGTLPSINPDEDLHPFDCTILCGAQKNHGDERWRFVDTVHYIDAVEDGTYSRVAGPHPIRGDE